MKVSRLLLILFLAGFFNTASAQLSDPALELLVKNYTIQLNKNGIDTICIYQEYCNGCLFHSAEEQVICSQNILFLPTYILWVDKGNTFMTRKDACFDYSVVKISNPSFWTFYFANKQTIKKEVLKKPQYTQQDKGKATIVSLDVEHSVFFRITIKTAKDSVVKNINNFYFTEKLGPDEALNLNYHDNSKTLLKKLHDFLHHTVTGEERKKMIKTVR